MYSTTGERIRALQALAREADQTTPTPDPAAPAAAPVFEETQATTVAQAEQAAPAAEPPAPAFARAKPFNLDPRALLDEGMQAAQLVGIGVNYTGNRASPDGEGAITSVEDLRGEQWGALRIVCTLEDGRTINAEPHDFTATLRPILQFNAKHHGAPYLAQLAGAALMHQVRTTSAADLAKQSKEKALQDLPKEYSYLQQYTQGGKLWGVTLAAANIRTMLKRQFTGVKFSVKSSKFSMHNSLTVSWTDGPTDNAVNEIVGLFSGGSFQGEDDCYEHRDSPFTDLFGEAKYTHTRREESDTLIQTALDKHYEGQTDTPSVSDYRNFTGKMAWDHDSDRRCFDETLSATTL